MSKRSRKDQSPEARRARAEAKQQSFAPTLHRRQQEAERAAKAGYIPSSRRMKPISPMLLMMAARKLGGPITKEWTR